MPSTLRNRFAYMLHFINRLHRLIFIERCAESLSYLWEARPQRYDLINALIDRKSAQNYLEIGCRNDECFARIQCARKVGVDPDKGGTLRMTSDEYFARHTERFDVIFIDGLHLYEQVLRDMNNALARLNAGGVVLVHDCLPLNVGSQARRIEQAGPWNGDVWKAFVFMRCRPEIDSIVCAIDHGIGMLGNRPNQKPLQLPVVDFRTLCFADLVRNHRDWLNLMEYEDALRRW